MRDATDRSRTAVTLGAVDAVILCGGKGTRLQPVISDRPKGLAPVRGRALLDILVDDLVAQGLRRVILCVGHLKEQIIEHFSDRREADFLFSEETAPLGTGGAVKNAGGFIQSDPFLVMNGDSICRVDLKALLEFHHARDADLTMVVAEDPERGDVGAIRLGTDCRILSFHEKPAPGSRVPGHINAGIYLFKRTLLDSWLRKYPLSLEHDVFPQLADDGRCFGFAVTGSVVDIGTPERYRRVQSNSVE
jgi:D-glycero-alpha-D-manno-heptose 1-phosphate guanylyltransferase